ncbi:lytic murein transglycosylase [Oleispirillum naphthae]|uniref:lytic murein transglycosylase n=1 Tax=Oleispirillum naphthae TaxID=2838853 RepID=UPI00308259EA
MGLAWLRGRGGDNSARWVRLPVLAAALLVAACAAPQQDRPAAEAAAPGAEDEAPIHAPPPPVPVTAETLAPLEPPPNPNFTLWLKDLRAEARGKGIKESTLDAAFRGVRPIPRVIELDRNQPEFKLTYRQYMERVVPMSRVLKGRRMLAENKALLERIAGKYGVQPRFLVAFWGVETDFGRVTGGFPVIPALATLAHDGRRSSFFRNELMNALKIIDEGNVTPERMVGSWAGAMGQCQFMPSSFVRFAVDEDGDGRKDLWASKADVFASAANYLKRSGWKGGQGWGRAVSLPKRFDRKLAGQERRSLKTWAALGVRDGNGKPLPQSDATAALMLPEADGGPAFLVSDNFFTILKWNRSNYYALAVGQLADALATR